MPQETQGHEKAFHELRRAELERCLSDAVSEVMNSRRADPIDHLVECLQRAKTQHKGVAAAKSAALAASSTVIASKGAGDTADGPAEWSVASWLAGMEPSPTVPLASVLLRPLGDSPPLHVALQFMRSLGGNKDAVRSLLDGTVLDDIAEVVSQAAAQLSSSASSALELSNKFAESTFTLSYGGLETFYEGLEGRIGAPNPNVQSG